VARRSRLDVAGVPQHVIQRGNDRAPCFFSEADYLAYLHWLGDACKTYGVSIHAYCLMTNHVHLLLTPAQLGEISNVMQYLGRHYVNYVNRVYGRSGTLWEGRYKSSVVESEAYLLTLYRYIEQNPVRAGMVEKPEDYRWSSAKVHVSGAHDDRLSDHDVYLRLGGDHTARREAYRVLLETQMGDEELGSIRAAVRTNLPLGTERFKDQIEAVTHRRARPWHAGRPAREHRATPPNQLNLEV
jgi:putative transposase